MFNAGMLLHINGTFITGKLKSPLLHKMVLLIKYCFKAFIKGDRCKTYLLYNREEATVHLTFKTGCKRVSLVLRIICSLHIEDNLKLLQIVCKKLRLVTS